MTALDLCKDALGLLGVYDSDEELTAADAQKCLRGFNGVIEQLSLELGMLPKVDHSTVQTVAGKTVYTIGGTGDWPITRPVKVADLTCARYQGLPSASVPFTADNGYPLITVALEYVPSGEALELYVWNPLTAIADLTTEVLFPLGYAEMFTHVLAIRMAPVMQTSAPAEVVSLAQRYIGNIKRINAPDVKMQCDPALLSNRCFDIRTGGL